MNDLLYRKISPDVCPNLQGLSLLLQRQQRY